MRKAKSLLGLNIISQLEGKQLGTVRDLIFDEEAHKLLAVLLSDRELFGMIDATVVPWPEVQQIGPHAIMVPSESSIRKAHANPEIAKAFDQKKRLVGKKITTQDGEELGTVGDLYLNDDGGVQGFEVSGGIFSDAFSGKRFMQLPPTITVGQDRVLVPQGIALELKRQKVQEPGGLSAVAAKVSERTEDFASKANEAYETTKTRVSEGYANIANASVEKQRDFVIGKTASRDVVIPASRATMATPEAIETLVVEDGGAVESATIPVVHTSTPATATDVTSTGDIVNGEVLVRQGETITAAHADRAIAAKVLPQLVASAAGTLVKNTFDRVTDSPTRNISGASDQYVAAVDAVPPGTDAVPITDTSSSGVVDRLEAAAIGKPSAREILAEDGSVIIAPGMIVTREILANADLYGKKGEVIAAAGLGAASEKTQAAYATAKESAGTLWETIKEKTAELTGTAQEKKAEHNNKVEQNKINNALGRPVTRVILAKDDSVILNTGDLITNSAVNRAREAGVLDILLASVYEVDPHINPEMLRVQGKGEAALNEQVVPAGTAVVPDPVETPETDETLAVRREESVSH